jgi:Skp family chaperone for outer membrane proteins
MNRNALTVMAAVAAAFGVGLAWSWFGNPNSGRVAVVDLDAVAHRLGRDVEMKESIKAEADRLAQTVEQAKQNALNQLEEARKGLGANPPEEERNKLSLLQQLANRKLNQLGQQASTRLNQHQQLLINEFRNEAKPITERVAKERGFSTVVTKNDAFVFAHDERVDITSDVIQLMSAEMPSRPAARPAAKPAQPGPAAPSSAQNATAAAQNAPAPMPATPQSAQRPVVPGTQTN